MLKKAKIRNSDVSCVFASLTELNAEHDGPKRTDHLNENCCVFQVDVKIWWLLLLSSLLLLLLLLNILCAS